MAATHADGGSEAYVCLRHGDLHMDDSVVVSDERLAVRKHPVALDGNGLAGVELVVTARVDATVPFRIYEDLPDAVALDEVRLFRERDGGQWWSDAEGHRLVFQGSVGPGEELVTRWAVPAGVDRSGGALLRPPEVDSSPGTVEVGTGLDDIGETIRRLESRFGRSSGASDDDDVGPAEPAGTTDGSGEAGDRPDDGSLVADLLDEIEGGGVPEPQLAALREHLAVDAARRQTEVEGPGDRSADREVAPDPVAPVAGDADSVGPADAVREGLTTGRGRPAPDDPTAAGDAGLEPRLRELEERVDRIEAAVEERGDDRKRRAARIDALEAELGEAVRELRADLEDVRRRRRRMADALRRPGETSATE